MINLWTWNILYISDESIISLVEIDEWCIVNGTFFLSYNFFGLWILMQNMLILWRWRGWLIKEDNHLCMSCSFRCAEELGVYLTIVHMVSYVVSSGALVTLEELKPSSPHFQNGTSLRVTGKWVVSFHIDFVVCQNLCGFLLKHEFALHTTAPKALIPKHTGLADGIA